MPSNQINIVRPNGTTFQGTLQELERLQLLSEGYRAETPPELEERVTEQVNKDYAEEHEADTFFRGMASGATLGGTDLLIPPNEAERYADQTNSGYRLGGELIGGVVGSVAGVGPAGALSKAATSAGRAVGKATSSRLAGTVAVGAVEGAGAGVQQAISESTLDASPLTASEIIAGAGWNSIFGMGLGAGFHALGRGLSAAGRALTPKVLPPPLKTITDEFVVPATHHEGGTEFYDELISTLEPGGTKATKLSAEMDSEIIERSAYDIVDDISPVGEEEFNKLKSSIDEFSTSVPEPTGFTPKAGTPYHPAIDSVFKSPSEFEQSLTALDSHKDEILSVFEKSGYDPVEDGFGFIAGPMVNNLKHLSTNLAKAPKGSEDLFKPIWSDYMVKYNALLDNFTSRLNHYLKKKGINQVSTLSEKGIPPVGQEGAFSTVTSYDPPSFKTIGDVETVFNALNAKKSEVATALKESGYDLTNLPGNTLQSIKQHNDDLKYTIKSNEGTSGATFSVKGYASALDDYIKVANNALAEMGKPPLPPQNIVPQKTTKQWNQTYKSGPGHLKWTDKEKEMVRSFGQMDDLETREAIQHWKGAKGDGSYTGMQSEARYYDRGKWTDHAERLQEAIESGRLPNNMKLYRGINNYPVENLKIGVPISTHGFTATSIDKSQAEWFAKQSIAGLLKNKSGPTGLVLEMDVKKGTPALYVQEEEGEILFGKRTRLVLKTLPKKGEDGLYYAKAKLLPGVSPKYTASKLSEIETIFAEVDEMADNIYDDIRHSSPEKLGELTKMKAAGERATKALRTGKFKVAKEGLDEYIMAVKNVEHLSDIKTGIPTEAARVFVSAASKKLLKDFPKSRAALNKMSEGKLEQVFGSLDAIMQDVSNPMRYAVESEISSLVEKSGLKVDGNPVEQLKKVFEIQRASKTDKLITTIEDFIRKPVVEKIDLEAEEQLADELITKRFKRKKTVDKEVYFTGTRDRLVPTGKPAQEVSPEVENVFSIKNKLIAHGAGAIVGSTLGWGFPGLAGYYLVKNYMYGGSARLGAMKSAVKKRIGKAADFTGKKLQKPGMAKISAVMAPLYTRLDGTPANEKSKEEAAANRIREIVEAAPSINEVLYKAMEPMIGEHPELAASLHAQAAKSFTAFFNMMPKDPGVSFSGMKSLWKPNSLQIVQFAKLKHVFDSPLEVIDEFLSGDIDNYKVVALRTLHPEIWEDLRQQVMSTLDFTQLSYNEQSRMSQLLDLNIHSSFSPQATAEAQRIFMETPESQVKKKGGGNSGNSSVGKEPATLGQTISR